MGDESGIINNFPRLIRLSSKHGYFLRITEDRVEGIADENDKYVSVEMTSVGAGEVTLRGKNSKRFIAMSSTGSLYTTDEKSDECVFKEIYEAAFNSYRSKKYPDWYLAISKYGQAKYGPKTAPGQRAVKFLTNTI
ncbi:fibroblast growth factor 2-like [Acropora millepora]|uniref:fibroblast growth factor 2-like n=1 Tax=Acropora millepora TaxID=45264 RepID=UPI001CF2EB3F|nr:fibroblast growth factor 2-like [Acropora millepora]